MPTTFFDPNEALNPTKGIQYSSREAMRSTLCTFTVSLIKHFAKHP